MPVLSGTLVEWKEFGVKSWGRGTLRVDESGEVVPVVGVIAGAREGNAVELDGQTELHPRFGEQFVVRRAQVHVPRSEEGVIAWLAATLPNVGKRRAAALLTHCRGDVELLWRTVVDSPLTLCEVEGINEERALAIRDAYLLARDDRDSQIALRGWGLTEGQVGRCVKHWGSAAEAVDAIRTDPYELSMQVDGFGWVRADEVARMTGIKPDAPNRIHAAIEHVMRARFQEGHVFMLPGHMSRAVRELLGPEVSRDALLGGIRRALKQTAIIKRAARVYLRTADSIESLVATRIARRIDGN